MTRLGVDKVKPKGWFKFFLLGGWVGGFGWLDASKIEDVLAEDGGLLHVLTLAVHLKFF